MSLSLDTYYHLFNHANGSENLFRVNENYRFFLEKYSLFIPQVADTFAYCLMPNHIHLLVRIKSQLEIEQTFEKSESIQKLEGKISKQFSNLFSSYTQSYNKVYARKGSLFIPNFKRRKVESKAYFMKLVHYIHSNPVHHGFVKNMADWTWSSYHAFLFLKPTRLKRDEVFEWFDGQEHFRFRHNTPANLALDMDF
jgi:REP element-mobilizing transposase RayT